MTSEIDAVPVRRPGRWIAAIAVALMAAAVVRSVATNPRFEWGVVGEMLFSDRILRVARRAAAQLADATTEPKEATR